MKKILAVVAIVAFLGIAHSAEARRPRPEWTCHETHHGWFALWMVPGEGDFPYEGAFFWGFPIEWNWCNENVPVIEPEPTPTPLVSGLRKIQVIVKLFAPEGVNPTDFQFRLGQDIDHFNPDGENTYIRQVSRRHEWSLLVEPLEKEGWIQEVNCVWDETYRCAITASEL